MSISACPVCGRNLQAPYVCYHCATPSLYPPSLYVPTQMMMREMEPKPEPPVPRVTGKILGFRYWALDGYRLLSANRKLGAYWTIGVNKAECKRAEYRASMGLSFPGWLDHPLEPSNHPEVPARNCTCGLHALHAPHTFGPFPPSVALRPSVVFGAVLAWGRLEIHEDGFRAEYAEPVIFAWYPKQPKEEINRIRAIGGEMGIPVVPTDELEAAALKYGKPVSKNLRPVDLFAMSLPSLPAPIPVSPPPLPPRRKRLQRSLTLNLAIPTVLNFVFFVFLHSDANLIVGIFTVTLWAVVMIARRWV